MTRIMKTSNKKRKSKSGLVTVVARMRAAVLISNISHAMVLREILSSAQRSHLIKTLQTIPREHLQTLLQEATEEIYMTEMLLAQLNL